MAVTESSDPLKLMGRVSFSSWCWIKTRMKVGLLKYQKDAAKLERLKREAAELILSQEELTWGCSK